MNDEDEDAKQRDPNRGHVGPGVETGPPSVISLLQVGQGAYSSGLPIAMAPAALSQVLEMATAILTPLFGTRQSRVELASGSTEITYGYGAIH